MSRKMVPAPAGDDQVRDAAARVASTLEELPDNAARLRVLCSAAILCGEYEVAAHLLEALRK